MLVDLLTTEPFLTRLTLPFFLAWAALFCYLMFRVGRAALARRAPHMAWWYVAGLVLLPAAPLAEAPFIFGLGAALMLLGAWHPLAFTRPRNKLGHAAKLPPRPTWQWSPVALLFGAALLTAYPNYLGLGTGLALVLHAVVRLFSALLWGRGGGSVPETKTAPPANILLRPPPLKQPPPELQARWRKATEPAAPELGLALETGKLQLSNLTGSALILHGWMPLDTQANSFFSLEQPLGAHATHALRWKEHWRGVRVWYSRLEDTDEVRVLRADWEPPEAGGAARWLN